VTGAATLDNSPVDACFIVADTGELSTLMKLYSVAEAAVRLGIDASLVRAYIRQGRIRSERTEPPYVISEASLARFERNRPVRGRPRRTP